MKIGVEATTLGEKSTGTNRYLNCLIEQLEKTPHQITKFSLPAGNKNKHSILQPVRKNWYRNFGLNPEIEKSNVDCMIFPNYYMPHNTAKTSAVVIHDLSFISHPQFYSKSFVKYYNYQLRQTLKQNPTVVTISEHSKRNIIKYLGLKEEDIFILQGYSKFIQSKVVTNNFKNSAQPYFLYVGHIEPRKNLRFLIEGFLKWKSEHKLDVKLKIVGELWIKSPETTYLLKHYSNNPDVEFTGYISDEKLKEAYQNASAFIHTSFEEGFGFPVLEAMHYNLPILCTERIATEEISQPFSITVNPYNEKDYFHGLEKLFQLVKVKEHIQYDIKYSPDLMSWQLNKLLDMMESKVNKIYPVEVLKARTNEEAVEKTFVYSSIFNSGIRKNKIHQQIFDVKLSKDELNRTLTSLVLKGRLLETKDSYQLTNSEKSEYIQSKNKINKKKLNKLLNFLKKLPLVSSIAFSGGSSNYGIENHNDVDLFIITKPHSVYLVYFIIHIYSILFKVRKELCANYLIDETHLFIDYSFDLYTAHQIISLTPFKNNKMLNYFWKKNEWVKNFFPNFEFQNIENDYNKTRTNRFMIFKPINEILLSGYKFLYRKKLQKLQQNKSILLTEHCIKLHTNDHRLKTINEFEKAWTRYCESKTKESEISSHEEEIEQVSKLILQVLPADRQVPFKHKARNLNI